MNGNLHVISGYLLREESRMLVYEGLVNKTMNLEIGMGSLKCAHVGCTRSTLVTLAELAKQ
jgi:hypothetical protein